MLREIGILLNSIEARLPLQLLYLDIPSYHIKYLQENYLPRLLQENMLYASKNGYTTMRYPTRDTAIKVEGYEPTLLFGNVELEQQAIKLLRRIQLIEFLLALGTNPFNYRKLSLELSKAKLEYNLLKLQSTGSIYSPLEETILKKYDLFPKMFEKIFKNLKPSIVKDTKGNSWFEFTVPKDI